MLRTVTRAMAFAAAAADLSMQFVFGFVVAFCAFMLALPLLNGIVPLPGA